MCIRDRNYLVPRQVKENGLKPDQVRFSDEIIKTIIAQYTREAGVRSLERRIGAVCRARASAIVRGKEAPPEVTPEDLEEAFADKRYEPEAARETAMPGVVTGLAFTPVGGEILFIEATHMPGNGNLDLTGQIGGVMRESAVAAFSIVRSRAEVLQINPDTFQCNDIHIHVPAGAVPKDGPSAGCAMLCSLISALTGLIVDPHTAMTGEVTLSGRVLPVGGVREKVLAAHRAGLERVILPARNERDLRELPDDVRENIEFVLVRNTLELVNVVFPGLVAAKTARKKKPKKKTTARKKPTKKKASRKKAAKKRVKKKAAKRL